MIRYRFQGAAHYIIHVGQMVCGVALSLLGLLNIGSESVFQGLSFDLDPHIKPLYKLVETDWALPIIVFCYTIVNVASMVSVVWQADSRSPHGWQRGGGAATLESRLHRTMSSHTTASKDFHKL